METKINVAELLKDCPKGMELDSPIWDGVVFDHINMEDTYPIYIKKMGGQKEYLTENGCFDSDPGAKCVIFPKGKDTWDGFQRPFKDGDIVCNIENAIIIYQRISPKGYCGSFASLDRNNIFIPHYLAYLEDTCRFATEEEKQKLFKAIKDNGYKWNPDTKTLEELEETKFKDGDILTTILGSIFILKGLNENGTFYNSYVALDFKEEFYKNCDYSFIKNGCRFATEEEKKKLFDSIRANGYRWNFETKTLENLIVPNFKIGDRIADIGGNRTGEILYIDVDKYHVAVSNNIGIDVFFEDQDDWELVNDNFENKTLIKPKFKEGDRIILKDNPHNMPSIRIKKVTDVLYILDEGFFYISSTDERYVLEDKFHINNLKPFDRVLVRDENTDEWCGHFFSYYVHRYRPYVCIGGDGINDFKQCIPYEGNEHLLGKTDECDDFYKTWEE